MSTDQLDRSAREHFLSSIDSSAPQAFVHEGKKIALTGSDRMARINRNAKVIASSDSLSMAVIRLLQEQGIAVEQQPLITDPASGTEQVQVLGLRITHDNRQLVAPIVPGAEVLRLYASAADGGLAANDVVATLSPVLEPVDSKNSKSQPWATAAAIAAAVRTVVMSE